MSEIVYEQSPIRIFVVWHPLFPDGELLFKALNNWLGGRDRELYHRGLGVPVHPWTTSSPDAVPRLPPLGSQSLTVIVAILDAELLGRRQWRQWFDSLDKMPRATGAEVVVLSWAVHPAATHLSGVSPLHLLGSGRCSEHQLRRRVTEACASRVRDPKTPSPLHLFLSYARRDGAPVVADVRRALQEYGHLSVFLDEHDLQPGTGWREELNRHLDGGAAMFAVVTDAYASRAWCREELRRFREPRREAGTNRWSLRPVFILDHLGGTATRSMFEVGSAPIARWNAEKADDLVDELVREVLFAEANRARAASVKAGDEVQVINWVPDIWTLLLVLQQEPKTTHVAYPGDELPAMEWQRLFGLFPQVTLCSFEELSRGTEPHHEVHSTGSSVLISVSNPPAEDLAQMGLHSFHLDDAAVRLARMLLYEGFDVMYGGRARTGFTDAFQDDSGAIVVESRFINYLGWPFTKRLGASQIADGFGITRYVCINWKGEAAAREDDPLCIADAATATRRAVLTQPLRDLEDKALQRPKALVALGGQVSGFTGFLPGVAEEIAMAIEEGLAVYVLGGFGGAAGAVGKVLSGSKTAVFTKGAFENSEPYRKLMRAARIRRRQAELSRRLKWLLQVLEAGPLRNGLSDAENIELFTTSDLGRCVALVSKGLRALRK